MNDETAKTLAEAMNRLAAAIEAVSRPGLMGGIQVIHSGFPQQQQYLPNYRPNYQASTGYCSGLGPVPGAS